MLRPSFSFVPAGLVAVGITILSALPASAGTLTADFEDLALPTPESYDDGATAGGGFTSRGVFFNNTYTDFGTFQTWSGWALSNRTDVTTAGYLNQYSAYAPTAGGGDDSATYGVAYVSGFDPAPAIELPAGWHAVSARVANTTYAALSMLLGDSFAKKFGGETGLDPDYFRLTIQGWDALGEPVGSVEQYLADFRPPGPQPNGVLDHWTTVDLSSLSGARKLTFALDSSDVDPEFGMNTPAYFALDNLLIEGLMGDANGDCLVGAADYAIWAAQFGRTGPLLAGDFDGNGVVGTGDYALWAANFGRTCDGIAQPVPEPGTASLALAALALGMLARGPWRRRPSCQSRGR